MRHHSNGAIAHRHDVVIEAFEREAVQVGEIAGDVELGHLPLAARQILAARQPALEQHQARTQIFARPDEDLVGAEIARLRNGIADRPLLLRADVRTLTQLLEVNGDHEPRYVHSSGRFAVHLGYTTVTFHESPDYLQVIVTQVNPVWRTAW